MRFVASDTNFVVDDSSSRRALTDRWIPADQLDVRGRRSGEPTQGDELWINPNPASILDTLGVS
jgi:hypothetical protein